jgi:T-complex protein 1 subunit zeta
VRDGLRAVKNLIDDRSFVPGAGAFEIACSSHLMEYKNSIQGKAKLGVQVFAEALLIIPKILAENSGYDVQDAIIELMDNYKSKKTAVGLNVEEFGTIAPETLTILDNYSVKKQFLNIAPALAEQLLLVDEVILEL